MPDVRIKYLKKENKYTVDFRDHPSVDKLRFDAMKKLNESYDFALFIDTMYGKFQHIDHPSYFDLEEEKNLKEALAYLEKYNIRHRFHNPKVKKEMKVLGLKVGERGYEHKPRLCLYLEKGHLTEEIFCKFMCTHDYFVGLGVHLDLDQMMDDFYEGAFTETSFSNEHHEFEETLVDSRMMLRFFTTIDMKPYF